LIPKNYELEHGIYISNEQKIGEKLTIKYGIRYSAFQNMGKTSTYKYDSNHNVVDSLSYASGKIFHTYQGLEPRLGANYTLDDFSSVKASYSRTIQYMQLASNSNGGMPLDVWFPASPNVKPPKADQFALGYVRNFLGNILETSVEAYYKKMYDVVDFKDHASLLMNSKMEGEIRIGKAESYGLEFMIKKNEGKLNGWVSYTLSKTTRKVPEINDGRAYPAPYDKPNSVNVILNYEFTKRITLSANWIYATGAPVTLPVGSFEYGNTVNKIYANRNGYRMRDYHRLDLSLTIKPKKKAHLPGFADICWNGEWIFSVYNAYGRHNDWIINFVQDEKKPEVMQAERWYLPFLFFPAITYNFNF